jgi:hypothetical protein
VLEVADRTQGTRDAEGRIAAPQRDVEDVQDRREEIRAVLEEGRYSFHNRSPRAMIR